MRALAALSLGVTLLLAVAPDALAHGGGGRPAPGGLVPAPTLPCDCGRIDCPLCGSKALASGEGLTKRDVRFKVVRSWGEVAEVRVVAEFQAASGALPVEGAVRVERGPLLAVVGGDFRIRGPGLTGALTPARSARRDYLWELRRLEDPLLVLREGAGAATLRVFPVIADVPSTATLSAFVILPLPAGAGPRAYRTKERVLLVSPRTPGADAEADVVDAAGDRAVRFLSDAAFRARFARFPGPVYEVPCVPALEAAARGEGDAAVTEETAIVALHTGLRAPVDLFIGPAARAPLVAGRFPPGMHEPTDPPPPPPPPETPPTPARP